MSKAGQRAKEVVQKRFEAYRAQMEAYTALCRAMGEEPAVVALAWLLHNPTVTAIITGPRTVQQLECSMRALDIGLGEETLSRLDEIWPGPGMEAGLAYHFQ